MENLSLQDRKFGKLRLSLTSQCNYNCAYCGSEEGDVRPASHSGGHRPRWTGVEQFLERVAAIHQLNPLRQVHLTGGEPLLYPHLVPLVEALHRLGIPSLAATTNGSLLKKMVRPLMQAGLDSVNVSLDAVDPEIYRRITGFSGLEKTLESVDAAIAAGLRVKLNAAIIRGYNEGQVVPLLEYARSRNIRIRYIELMEAGPARNLFAAGFVSQQEILDRIARVYPPGVAQDRQTYAARYFSLQDGYEFGIIANTSDPFCSTCDRLRMDADGNIYGCLNSTTPKSILGEKERLLPEEDIQRLLMSSMQEKSSDRFLHRSGSLQFIGG